ncbi:TPA: hypothetical protein DEP96_02240 [Candidatus Uhrbacteria bacterium]|nr:hypothetical protein [Candidatus Uhrbacteria bacterium]
MTPFLFLILLAIVISAAYAGYSAAPWVPTKPAQRQLVLDNLKFPSSYGGVRGGLTVVDLGCGDGAWLFAFAAKYPSITAIGYDISLLPLVIGQLRKLLSFKKFAHVHLRFGNLWRADISQADVVLIFLMRKIYPRLITKLSAIPPHALVAIEAWPLPNLTPIQTITGPNLLPVYIYRGEQFHRARAL